MEGFLKLVGDLSGWIWGTPMLIILVGGSLWLTISLGFFQFKYFPFIMRETFGKIFQKAQGEGTISPFQAATSALASTIGASNIVGVPVAIAFGGPGAIFWMWLVSLIGAASKFSEIILGIKYREKNENGEYVGGPMYYLRKGLKSPFMGALFAFGLMVELIPSIATQTVSVVQTANTIGIPNMASGVVVAVVVALVVYGGIKRIAQVTEKLVPFMAMLYLVGAFIIIIGNASRIPEAIMLIFGHAFTPIAATGGFTGAAIAQSMRWGIARGVYSNEAGMGTAPIAHAAAITDHPARQALWGIFEIVVDTLIVCTTTAFVVLTTGIWKEVPADQAASMPARAFQSLLGDSLGGGIVTFSILMFVISTIIVVVYYGEKQAEYLFGIGFSKVMRVVYILAIFLGAVGGIEFLYQFLDILLAAIIIPNMIGLVLMTKEVKEIKDDFFNNPKYYPGARTKERV
ncbi:MAG: sodium:alanine symporter family protein [Anaeromicrobium sp.]|jgi:AGCS family alanine or glycine:cation symporter|uniref:alanine/glycine:cation symporter family protein n=1 Tax=Anaeromicrobium sp. TaxID=1929132 RepID=UPI0025EF2A3B|nr:sodium:alanine symporter family protein [Anaeromicrobium sp.]MCT4595136.1 sodium:alanine symporter family protein [Anaeromicrobium sp.]